MQIEIIAYGHANVRSSHRNSLEFTKEEHLTPRGDCIIAVRAEKALEDLPEAFKTALRSGATIKITVECNGYTDVLTAHGHPGLTFKSDECAIIRKSNFVCDRTLCIGADKAASDLDRNLVRELQKGLLCKITLKV